MTCLNHASFHLFDSCQKRFLWTHKEVDFASHPVIGLMLQLQIGDMEKFPHALGFESLDPFFLSQQAGSMFHSHAIEDGGDKRLVQLELCFHS